MKQTWKQLERDAAEALGGQRNRQIGSGGPDVLNVPGWIVECKYRATFNHDSLYREERKKRLKELKGKKFLLVTRAKNKSPLVVLALEDFAELIQ